MRTVTEVDGALVVTAGPPWLGVLLIVLGIVLLVGLFIRKLPRRVARLGALFGTILLVVAGWFQTSSKTTLEPRGFYVESIYGEEQRVGWSRIRQIAPAEKGVKYDPDELVLQTRTGSEVAIDLWGLAPEERARVTAFVKKALSKY
jgi:hypothetical protein